MQKPLRAALAAMILPFLMSLPTDADAQLEKSASPGAKAPKKGEEVAVLDTNHGKIILRFFPDKAPKHVASFKKLAKSKFYDGTRFHRVIPGFMIQGGDPLSKKADRSQHGTGGPGFMLKAEFSDTPHKRGIVSMARANEPDTAGSQFFIVVEPSPFLDRKYTAFGEVTKGLGVADKIVMLPRNDHDLPNERIEITVTIVE